MATALKKWYLQLNEDNRVLDIVDEDTGYLYDEIDETITIDEIKKILEFDSRIFIYKEGMLTSTRKSEATISEEFIKQVVQQTIAQQNLESGLFSEARKVKVDVTGTNVDFKIEFENEFEEPPVVTFALLDPSTNRTVVIKEVTEKHFVLKSSYFRTAQEVHYTAVGKIKT